MSCCPPIVKAALRRFNVEFGSTLKLYGPPGAPLGGGWIQFTGLVALQPNPHGDMTVKLPVPPVAGKEVVPLTDKLQLVCTVKPSTQELFVGLGSFVSERLS